MNPAGVREGTAFTSSDVPVAVSGSGRDGVEWKKIACPEGAPSAQQLLSMQGYGPSMARPLNF